MQGGIIGSLYFLAFLLSFGIAQNLEERSGLSEDEFDSNDGVIYSINTEEHRNADKSSRLFPDPMLILYNDNHDNLLGGLGPQNPFNSFGSGYGIAPNYGESHALSQAISTANNGNNGNHDNLLGGLGPQNPFNSFGSGYGIAPNYGESHALSQAISTANDFNSNYAIAEADANAQALAELSSYGSPYNAAYYGGSSNYAQAQANAHASNKMLNLGLAPSSLGPSASTSVAQAQAIAKNLDSSYTDSEADALAQAYISGLKLGEHESSVFGPDSLAHSLGNAQAQAEVDALAQKFSGGSFGLASAGDGNSQALPLGGSVYGDSPIGLWHLGSEYSPAAVNAQTKTSNHEQGQSTTSAKTQSMKRDSGLDLELGSSFEDAHSGENVYAFSDGKSGFPASSNAFTGILSRVIPYDEYVLPHHLSGGENIICSKVGELHNVWSEVYECLICACVSEYGYLNAVCVKCDLCSVPTLIPPSLIPIPPSPTIPVPIPQPEVSCDPLPTNTPFQNPLNPCQICICQNAVGLEADVRITCEESPSCATSNDLVIIPPIPNPPAPVPLPTCERFPPNVIFPHPFDICQSCECVQSDSSFSEHRIVCYSTPGCETIPAVSSSTVLPEPEPEPKPEPLPWPPKPSGPLPGPPPHKSCAPYPPNQQFQHPWDDCQICVCNEIYSIDVINIEVNCFTNPVCCRDYPESIAPPYQVPVSRPQSLQILHEPVPQYVPYSVPYLNPITIHQSYPDNRPNPLPISESLLVPVPHSVSVVQPQPKHFDTVCQFRELGEEFMYSKCRVCSCQIFGNVIVPVCRRPSRPECVALPAAIPVGNVVYIEPRCRYRQPLQSFTYECQSCVCQSVFNYVVAKCNIIPGCGHLQYSGAINKAEANAIANAHTGSFSNHHGFGHSHSSAEANAAAFSGSSGYAGYPFISGSSGSSFAESEALANQPSSMLYGLAPYSGTQAQATAEAEAISATSLYPNLYPKSYGHVTPLYKPAGTFGHAQSFGETFGHGQSFGGAIADSNAHAFGFHQGSGLLSGRPRIKSGEPENEETEESRRHDDDVHR